MKRYFKLLIAFLTTVILFILMSHVEAATTTLTASDTVTVGDTIKITVNVNAAQWNLTLTANGTKVGGWVETVNYKENLAKTFTTSYKTTAVGTVKLVLTGDITDVDQTNTEINKTKTVTVKEKVEKPVSGGSSGNSGSTTTTPEPKEPTFKSANKKVYATGTINLRSSWSTSSSATQVAKGTELTLTGTSSEKVNGYVWYRVTYKGATKYVSSSLVSTTKPKEEKSSNKNLSSLKIEGVELEPKFNKATTQYTANIDGDVTELKIEAKAEDSKSKVTIEGNKELKEGDNVIKIKVTAEDNTTRTYFLTATKGGESEPTTNTDDDKNNDTLQLSELKIERVNFENSFKPDIYTYELPLSAYVDKLDITAKANQEGATVEISGNKDFKEGNNIVNILVKSKDGTQTATYQIKVIVPEGSIAKAEETNRQNTLMYAVIGAVVAVAAIIIIFMIVRSRRNADLEWEEEEQNDEIPLRRNQEEIQDDEGDEKPRKSKGRHSV